MDNRQSKENCCGCHACYSKCPKQCIRMEEDEEGFLYPHIDESQCIHCGLCKSVCIMQSERREATAPNAYAAYALDESIRVQSSSGGIFALLARHVIQRGGVVCGAALNPDTYSVNHIFVEDVGSIKLLMTSKYVQSNMGNCYKLAKQYLETGRIVLFTGTPCQINGLKKYLDKEYENLFCQDIICHGVPSEKAWKMFLGNVERRNKAKVVYNGALSFREKSDGWKEYAMSIPLNKGVYRRVMYKDSYLIGFIHNLFLRPSCYACKSKGLSRSSDITLADFWGVDKCCPEMYDAKGVSLVMTYTEKGQDLWRALESEVKCKEVDWKDAVGRNPSAIKSVTRPEARDYFYEKVNEKNFARLVDKYTKKSLPVRIARKIKRIIKLK